MSYGASARRTVVTLFFTAAALVLVAYGMFEARKLIEGPQISIKTPSNGSATSSTAVTISGLASNISFLTVNDAPAYTDESGHFAVTLSPPPGYTVFVVQGVDRFGRRASQEVAFTVLNYCSISNS
ncbi:MAG TPA: hypothetical protein VG984_03975 [Candidatus Paceibacterota bacterium]|nr:hypothetical protein [Candidatus Paceibacterota bacterium]